MDNSTVTGDNMSILSVPYKDSRPSTPAPPVPRLPEYSSRPQSPLRNASPFQGRDDYFARQAPPSRGRYNPEMTPGYTPGYTPGFTPYTPDEPYEMAPVVPQVYDPRGELTDSTSLLYHERAHARDPPPSRPGRGGY